MQLKDSSWVSRNHLGRHERSECPAERRTINHKSTQQTITQQIMMLTDPIADLLTRIRNAAMARKDNVFVPYSNMKMGVLKVLQEKGFIQEFNTVKNNDFNEINIVLNPMRKDISLKKISKPGQRIYVKTTQLKKINGGLGVAVVSTPKGIMSGEEAKKQNLGGELICEIY